jgi:hypothetical protein
MLASGDVLLENSEAASAGIENEQKRFECHGLSLVFSLTSNVMPRKDSISKESSGSCENQALRTCMCTSILHTWLG